MLDLRDAAVLPDTRDAGPAPHRAVALAERGEVLDRILDPAVALAVWDRSLPHGLGAALARARLERVDDLSTRVPVDGAASVLASDLLAAGWPAPVAPALAADVGDLAARFGSLLGVSRLALRLEVVEGDACRRFHADYVTARLICTYVGPGTQWRPAADEAPVRQVGTGSVAIFKGRRLLEEPPVLHRSPPISGTGRRRLMLVLDPEPAD